MEIFYVRTYNVQCRVPSGPASHHAGRMQTPIYFKLYYTYQLQQRLTGCRRSGPRFNINMSSYQYRKSHCGDKTVERSFYLHNGISYTGKTIYFYWVGAQVEFDNNWKGHIDTNVTPLWFIHHQRMMQCFLSDVGQLENLAEFLFHILICYIELMIWGMS